MAVVEDFSAGMGRAPVSACPACAVVPAAERIAALRAEREGRIILSLPGASGADTILTVEAALQAVPGVQSARVNLTQKRVSLLTAAAVTPAHLVSVLADLGVEAHELDPGLLSATETDRQGRDLLMRVGVAFFSMMNVMLLSVAVWSGAEDATRDLFHWISAAIALPTVVFAGQPFFKSAWASLRQGKLGMDVPISLALILASSISVYETWMSGHHAYFDAAVMLSFFLLVGRYLDHRTRAIARSAAEELAALEVPRAIVLVDGVEVETVISAVAPGDLVLVRPGARMPVDGVVIHGASEIDRSLLTGESLPVQAGQGTIVSAGEVNLTGPLTVQVTAAGKDSSLHRMADLVAVAEGTKTRYTSLADRASRLYSPLVHILSFSAFGYWMWATGGDVRYAINISAAVLIITCPCALGLAVPAVITSASGKLFRKGLLIKHGTALERLAEVDTVVFDKTGTLTLGVPEPVGLAQHPADALALAAALAAGSSHPLARALADGARVLGIAPADVADLREVPGHGIEGQWQGTRVRLGRPQRQLDPLTAVQADADGLGQRFERSLRKHPRILSLERFLHRPEKLSRRLPSGSARISPFQQTPRNRLRRAAGVAPWGDAAGGAGGALNLPACAGRPESRSRPCRPRPGRRPWPPPGCGWCARRWARPCSRSSAGRHRDRRPRR